MTPFIKFPSLESFGHVWRNNNAMMGGPVVRYRPKIKLHGTNAAIRCTQNQTFGQKRTSDVTVEEDNAGFARWLEPFKPIWDLDTDLLRIEHCTFFGEWAGPGVQKGDAVANIPHKMFFIFAAQIDDEMVVDPDWIESMLPVLRELPAIALDDVVVLPWAGPEVVVDFSDPDEADKIAARLTAEAEAIGEMDPFIKDMFEIAGPGEGVVMTPIYESVSGESAPRDWYSRYVFKVKCERHGEKKATAASRRVAIPEGAKEFVEMFVTESRCRQALMEGCDGIAEKPRTPDFLKWIGGDIQKESEVELLEAGLEWKQVAKLVNNAAVRWFHTECTRPMGDMNGT